jgi:hypothetical protein
MSPSRSQLGTWPLPERLAQQVLPQVRFPSGAVPGQRGSLLLARPGSQLRERRGLLLARPGSQLQERPDSLLQERPADSQLEELRAEMFVVAREIALAKSAQMRVRLGRQ